VRYDQVNAMLLNEFLKEHRTVQEQKATITKMKSTLTMQETMMAQHEEEIRALMASLKEQAAQIQKVSDHLERSKAAPRMVVNNQVHRWTLCHIASRHSSRSLAVRRRESACKANP
jgi:predicted RNase H-like nuclease (RuvC/YqgF family)